MLIPEGREQKLGSKANLPHLAEHEGLILTEFSLPVFSALSVAPLHRMQRQKQGHGMFHRIRIRASSDLEPEGPLYRNK